MALAQAPSETQTSSSPWRGFAPADLAEPRQRPRVHSAELHPVRRRRARSLPGRPSARRSLWQKLLPLLAEEREKGVLDVSQVPSGILAHAPGYIDKEREIIVGLQTDAPLKRAIMPFGGWRVVEASLKSYGFEPDPKVAEIFTKYRKTHNDGVFDAYTPDIRKCRSSHIITGLPDAYGRGRIIGDYRRVALYGVDFLITDKEREKAGAGRPSLDRGGHSPARGAGRADSRRSKSSSRWRRAMASTSPGRRANAREATQWLYFGYLGGDQAAERRGDVGGPRVDVPGHLLRARSARGHADRVPGPGDHRRLRHQVAPRALPARARIQPAVLRRPGVGDRGRGRNGRGRPHAGDQVRLPHAEHALQARPGAGAEPHHVLVDAAAGRLQALRRQDVDRHQRDPVRERRPDAAEVGRRLRHRLLRLGDAPRQADAVLRRAREPASRRCSTR